MKNPPAEKYSRRVFTKSIATAFAVTPFIPTLVSAEEPGAVKLGRVRVRPRLAPMPLNLTLNHMPPLVFRSGSLEIESATELFTKNVADGIYTFEQRRVNGCFVYGGIRGVNIINDRGQRLYSEEADGRWKISLLLQKLVSGEEGALVYEPGPLPREQEVVIMSATPGSFEITIGKDLGNVNKVRRRKLNRYFTLNNYTIGRLGPRRFRIGQVTVTNEERVTYRCPDPGNPERCNADAGFEIFVEFDHDPTPGCVNREIIPDSKSFWRRFFSIFKF